MTICFSGHRAAKLCGWDARMYETVRPQLLGVVTELYDMGYRTFITGGAQGFDQLVFWAVEELKKTRPDARNWLFSPFPGHASRWAKTGLFSQADYARMVACADRHAITVNNKPDTKEGIGRALSKRNKDMLDASNALCAFMNPDELADSSAYSGTKSCVLSAKRSGKVLILWPYEITPNGIILK